MANSPTLTSLLLVLAALSSVVRGAGETVAELDRVFSTAVHPFLETYCVKCHGGEKTEAELDLTTYESRAAVVKDGRRWGLVL